MMIAQIHHPKKNKTETLSDVAPPSRAVGPGDGRCRFIVAEIPAAPPRFCGAPALPDSAYCRHHHRRCAIDPRTDAGKRALRELERAIAQPVSSLPAELAYLSSIAVPELESADEPSDIAACLDLALPRETVDE